MGRWHRRLRRAAHRAGTGPRGGRHTAGIVSGIAGIERLQATFTGQAGHAGTTPMDSRHDALCAAAEAVLAVERLASAGGVGTTGRLEVLRGGANVVPGKAEMWAEFRSIDGGWLDE